MVAILLGGLLLLWPLAAIPQLWKHKQQYGRYFSNDSRLFIPKYKNVGNGLNPQNKLALLINLLSGITLILLGISQIR